MNHAGGPELAVQLGVPALEAGLAQGHLVFFAFIGGAVFGFLVAAGHERGSLGFKHREPRPFNGLRDERLLDVKGLAAFRNGGIIALFAQ